MFKKVLLSVVLPFLAAHLVKFALLPEIHVAVLWAFIGALGASILTIKILAMGSGDIKFATINAACYLVLSIGVFLSLQMSTAMLTLLALANIASTLVLRVHPIEYDKYYNNSNQSYS